MSSLNVNVGILGHVDSGKTALAKALSQCGSTAAFDKSPQSRDRGITLDLGFSMFHLPTNNQAQFEGTGVTELQMTLVDCPGHASLIRTVIGGAHIIDIMLLVIDITHGVQTQTGECIVLGEMLGRRLIVVLNKIDLIAGETPEERSVALTKSERKLRAIMQKTRWPTAPFVCVSAAPGGQPPTGIDTLKAVILSLVDPQPLLRARISASPSQFAMLVDHCFLIKGQGTVVTGTVVSGKVAVGDDVLLPEFNVSRRVKGLQVFRASVSSASVGDRIGLCISRFDSDEMERGIVCAPKATNIHTMKTVIAIVQKVRFHKLSIEANARYHISIGHDTVMGTMRFFCARAPPPPFGAPFDFSAEYEFSEILPDDSAASFDTSDLDDPPPGNFRRFATPSTTYYAVVHLDLPVTALNPSTLIASRLDSDIHVHVCRLAVQGTVVAPVADVTPSGGAGTNAAVTSPPMWRDLNVVKRKQKILNIDRIVDTKTCIVRCFVKDCGEAAKFVGMKVNFHRGKSGKMGPRNSSDSNPAAHANEEATPIPGVIESTFGKTGKLKVAFKSAVFASPPKDKRDAKQQDGADQVAGATEDAAASGWISLDIKKYPFSEKSRIAQ